MAESETIAVENGADVILVLLFTEGSSKAENEEIVGNTRLEKLMFLLGQETSLKRYLGGFNFEPYNYGPFSSEVFDAIQALINAGLVKPGISDSKEYLDEADRYQIEFQIGDSADSPKTTITYSLTPEGKKVASVLFQALSEKEKEELVALKKRFNSTNLRKLLQYVYRKYPKFTTDSVIRDHVY